jgi:hypothetical protein
VGAARGPDPRLPRRDRSPRLQGRGDAREAHATRFGDVGAVPRELLDPGREPSARLGPHEGAALVPLERALRHRLGRDRRGERVLRHRAPLRAGPRHVLAPDRRLPARAGEARRDGSPRSPRRSSCRGGSAA